MFSYAKMPLEWTWSYYIYIYKYFSFLIKNLYRIIQFIK